MIMEAKKYYNKVKHKDSWGVDVVYNYSVDKIIEIAKLEGKIEEAEDQDKISKYRDEIIQIINSK